MLSRIGDGKTPANDLLPLVYSELRTLARARMAGEPAGQTMQATVLVHEAWLKLAGHLDPIENRRHFLIVAGRAMRQVVVDHARAKRRDKRGGGQQPVTLDTDLDAVSGSATNTPNNPSAAPPAISANSTTSGCSPSESPRIFGIRT